MTDYLTLFGTAMNKQPRQLLGIARRTVKSNVLPRLPVDIDARYERKIPDEIPVRPDPIRENTGKLRESTVERRDEFREQAERAASGELTFLNETVSFSDGHVVSLRADRIESQSLHWKLKCWGFEHLKHAWLGYEPGEIPEETIQVHREWLAEWRTLHPIAAETDYLRSDWVPHAVCLRIINWTRYVALFGDSLDPEFRNEITQFVYKNGAFLSDNVEHGVGGNHLIENAVALVIAGMYCDVEAWQEQGRQILLRAANEQFFGDGGHFERTPMYHLIVWQRYLTCYDLFESAGRPAEQIRACAKRAREFTENICTPDGRIPLLNDSVFGEALQLPECLAYSTAVGIGSQTGGVSEYSSMPETGYYWLGEEGFRVLVAANEIAVPHIPAHAHAQPGHICLWVDGKRLLTDTGVYEYAAGEKRDKSRSVGSHNTVQVGEAEPVRMASSFWLWGQLNPSVRRDMRSGRECFEFSCSADGVGQQAYGHKRRLECDGQQLRILDTVQCRTERVTTRFHIHPEFDTEQIDNAVAVTDSDGEEMIRLSSSTGGAVRVEQSPYYRAYGEETRREVIVIERERKTEIETTITRPDRTA